MSYIVIEGNIGAGKTTLVNNLAPKLNARKVLEEFKENPFLEKFYQNPQRYAFQLEMAFLADRYHQLQESLQPDLFHQTILADYAPFKNLIFAQVNLTVEDFNLYKRLWDISFRHFPKPDILIYIKRDINVLLRHIGERGRPFEKNIEVTYLEKLEKAYQQYLIQRKDLPIYVLDIEDYAIMENAVIEIITDDKACKKNDNVMHYIK